MSNVPFRYRNRLSPSAHLLLRSIMTERDEQLHADDALLLLFLSGELNDADAAAVRARLSTDAALVRRLEALRPIDDALHAVVAGESGLPAARSEQLLRKTIATVNRDALRRRADPKATAAHAGLRFPRWGLPLGVAAALVMGFGVWVLRSDGPSRVEPQIAEVPQSSPITPTDEDEILLADAFTSVDFGDQTDVVDQIEQELRSMRSAEGSDDLFR
jgi:hypothetical protein